jgi:HPt (histidine-containing phosphotransfer) domain-containing protein
MHTNTVLCDLRQVCELFSGDVQLARELLLVSKASLEDCRETVFKSLNPLDTEAIVKTAHKLKGIGLTIFSPCLVHASEIVERNSSAVMGEHIRELCRTIEIVEQVILEWTQHD